MWTYFKLAIMKVVTTTNEYEYLFLYLPTKSPNQPKGSFILYNTDFTLEVVK